MAGPGLPSPAPLPLPESATDILLFGGSFDPPHLAHTELALQARRLAAPDSWLVFVPAARSPHKPDPPAPDEHRLAMLELALAPHGQVAVWTDELDRAHDGAPSYWVETLRRARALRPEARLRFLIGSDQACGFHEWREPREILALAEPVVIPRSPITSREELSAALRDCSDWSADEIARWRDALVPTAVLESSATAARSILRTRGPQAPALERLLDPRVLDYIREHRLYTT